MTLDETETWDAGGEPAVRVRRRMRDRATDISRDLGGRPVEVYTHDGIVVDQISADMGPR